MFSIVVRFCRCIVLVKPCGTHSLLVMNTMSIFPHRYTYIIPFLLVMYSLLVRTLFRQFPFINSHYIHVHLHLSKVGILVCGVYHFCHLKQIPAWFHTRSRTCYTNQDVYFGKKHNKIEGSRWASDLLLVRESTWSYADKSVRNYFCDLLYWENGQISMMWNSRCIHS